RRGPPPACPGWTRRRTGRWRGRTGCGCPRGRRPRAGLGCCRPWFLQDRADEVSERTLMRPLDPSFLMTSKGATGPTRLGAALLIAESQRPPILPSRRAAHSGGPGRLCQGPKIAVGHLALRKPADRTGQPVQGRNRFGENRDLETDAVIVCPLDDKCLLTRFGMTRQGAVREPLPVGLINEVDDPTGGAELDRPGVYDQHRHRAGPDRRRGVAEPGGSATDDLLSRQVAIAAREHASCAADVVIRQLGCAQASLDFMVQPVWLHGQIFPEGVADRMRIYLVYNNFHGRRSCPCRSRV